MNWGPSRLVDLLMRWENVQSEFPNLNQTKFFLGLTFFSFCSFFCRWGQTYILEALMFYVPDEQEDAELLAERIAIRLQHSNSAVVLTTVKVILYLMNYMGSQEIVESMCRKLSPPLGVLFFCPGCSLKYIPLTFLLFDSHSPFVRLRSPICCSPEYPFDNTTSTFRPKERRQSLLLQVQRSDLC